MIIKGLIFVAVAAACAAIPLAAGPAKDSFPTSKGDLSITFITHATLMFEWSGLVVHVDPVSRGGAENAALPKADLILVTHEHGDHFDRAAIKVLSKTDTILLYTAKCASAVPGGIVLKNGDTRTEKRISVEAVPAYNIVHMRSPGQPFHPRGDGNGYILTFGDKRVYVAGDTENIPEMKAVKAIDIAFLPMNLPYTMDPEMAAAAAKVVRPKILYPYHYSQTDPAKLIELLKNEKDIEVRVRDLR